VRHLIFDEHINSTGITTINGHRPCCAVVGLPGRGYESYELTVERKEENAKPGLLQKHFIAHWVVFVEWNYQNGSLGAS
jgi:hypothetical protein